MAYDATKEKREVKALIDKNSRGDKIQVAKVTVEGRTNTWVDVRTMYTPKDSDALHATGKGIRFDIRILPDLIEALSGLKGEAEAAIKADEDALAQRIAEKEAQDKEFET